MLNPILYPPTFTRKSIRKYAETPLTPAQLALVREEIAKAVPLLPGEKYALELGESREGWRVYGYCGNTPLSNANLGFLMQQLDLALDLQGFGRLWFGMGLTPHSVKAPEGLSYAMALKVGVPGEPTARASTAEFDRKPMAEVTPDEALQALFEPVRLAPSARNSQPWRFTRDDDAITAYCQNPPFLLREKMGRMNQIDMGIALCHAVLALEHAGIEVQSVNAANCGAPEGTYGIVTLSTLQTSRS